MNLRPLDPQAARDEFSQRSRAAQRRPETPPAARVFAVRRTTLVGFGEARRSVVRVPRAPASRLPPPIRHERTPWPSQPLGVRAVSAYGSGTPPPSSARRGQNSVAWPSIARTAIRHLVAGTRTRFRSMLDLSAASSSVRRLARNRTKSCRIYYRAHHTRERDAHKHSMNAWLSLEVGNGTGQRLSRTRSMRTCASGTAAPSARRSRPSTPSKARHPRPSGRSASNSLDAP